MINDLLLHEKTLTNINNVINNPPHALLITGPNGSGKDTAAQLIASSILGIDSIKLAAHPYFLLLDPDENTIKIDEIRELQQFLKLKVPSKKQGINRVIVIARAQRMRAEAKNALLKTLEEPPTDTTLILTSESAENMLETIVSRCRELAILPLAYAQAHQFFSNRGVSEAKISSAYALSLGQAGLMYALINSQDHPLRESVDEAKSLLSQPSSQRLLLVDKLSKDKEQIGSLLNALSRICHAAIYAAAKKDTTNLSGWINRQNSVISATEYFKKNANTKLLLTDLFLRL